MYSELMWKGQPIKWDDPNRENYIKWIAADRRYIATDLFKGEVKGQDKLFSKKSDEWRTPLNRWIEWDAEFHFTFDAAASDANHLCDSYSSDSLDIGWDGRVWCNPPYSLVGKFVEKAWKESKLNDKCEVVVMLIPARTDTKWFHSYIYNQPNVEVRFLKGRLKFLDEFGIEKDAAPFPSMLVIFK